MASQRYMVDLPPDVMCGDFFDHMDDLLDFPIDEDGDFLGGIMETPYIQQVQHGDGGRGTPAFPTLLSPPPPRTRTESECDGGRGVTSPNNRTDTTALDPKAKGDQLLDELDIADLEWVSNFMDDSPDSLSLLNFPDAHINGDGEASTSPVSVSVIEEHSSFSGGSASSTTASSSSFSYSGASSGKGQPTPTPTPTHFNSPPLAPIISVNVPARARSKRPRPPTVSARPRPHVTIPFLPPPHPEPESFGESITPPAPAPAPAVNKSKKKKKNNHSPATGAGGEVVRKCMHCEIQKTPQWRAGPMGPKTLCNACGVRYKSGRLFPEYRPAASPTFVPSIHSNSHKKVVEMRINATHNGPNSCDLLDCIRSGTGLDRAHR